MSRWRIEFDPGTLTCEVEAETEDDAMDEAMPIFESSLFNGGTWGAELLDD